MKPIHLIFLILAALLTSSALADTRSTTQRTAFFRMNPCPVTGEGRGSCPGWIIDHIVPLCAGGRDHPENMQWQTVEAALAKDRLEKAECRALRRGIYVDD